MPPILSSATLSVYVGSMNPILKYNRRKFAVILLLTMVVFGLQQAKADFMSVLNQNNLGLSGTDLWYSDRFSGGSDRHHYVRRRTGHYSSETGAPLLSI